MPNEKHNKDALTILQDIREFSGVRNTLGISDDNIAHFLKSHFQLAEAIHRAGEEHNKIRAAEPELLKYDETSLCKLLQNNFVNFYAQETVSPYVPLAGSGPWIVTTHGAVLHDSGGYGMLGLGHAPQEVLQAMSQAWVMANVMTPSFSQRRLVTQLKKEIGHMRGECPFAGFMCLNSGSESVALAARISDINARMQTEPGGIHHGKQIKMLALEEGFHGRTDRPAQLSHSTLPIYRKHLASYRDRDNLYVIPPNDIEALHKAFRMARDKGIYFESFFIEPIMGEGSPGLSLTREFYDLARKLTRENHTMLVVDSIQAAIRAHGCLSIVDYPTFEDCEPPDMETYSKALNAGQYPLSVLALTEEAANLYVRGVYGNTMTTNPRALEVGCAVLNSLTDNMRRNIRDRGKEFVEKLESLSREFPGAIQRVSGTGLIVCAEMNPQRYKVVGYDGFEQYCRVHGVVMIHGGYNGLRFTPHFEITSAEIDLIIDTIRAGLKALGNAS